MNKCVFLVFATLAVGLQTARSSILPSSGRQEAEAPIDEACIAKARIGSCDFYTCFDIRHPCDDDNYALTYGWRFCNQFELNYSRLDDAGKRWLNATRKCAMTAMLEFYNDDHINCGDVEGEMVNIHGRCEAANGLCDVGMVQGNNQVFEEVYGLNVRTANRLIQALKHCGQQQASDIFDFLKENYSTAKDKIEELGNRLRNGFENIGDRISEWFQRLF